jgi:hypothetical protein
MSPDYLDDDQNVQMMRETAQAIGLTALVRDMRREQLRALDLLDANRARIARVLELLGESGEKRS